MYENMVLQRYCPSGHSRAKIGLDKKNKKVIKINLTIDKF